jgi:phage-related protein
VWDAIKTAVSTAINSVKSTISNVIDGIKATWSAGWDTLKQTVNTAMDAVKQAVSNAVQAVSDTVGKVATAIGTVKDKVTSALSGAGSWLVSSGKAIIQGLVDGITGMIGRAKDAISGVMQGIRNFLPFSPAKEGPFSGKGWTPYSGRAITEGLADGMEQRISRVRSAALAMTKAAQVGDLSLGYGDDSYGADFSAVNRDNAPVIVQGNVGYNPEELADAIAIRKKQAAIAAGMDMVQVR